MCFNGKCLGMISLEDIMKSSDALPVVWDPCEKPQLQMLSEVGATSQSVKQFFKNGRQFLVEL